MALKRIFRYLKRRQDERVEFSRDRNFELEELCDAN